MKIGTFTSLALKNEIIATNKKGIFLKFNALHFKFHFVPDNSNKIAFIIRKKLGNAPARNKLKRQIRSIIQTQQTTTPVHVLIIAKTDAFDYPFDRLRNEIDSAFSKLQELGKKAYHIDNAENDQSV